MEPPRLCDDRVRVGIQAIFCSQLLEKSIMDINRRHFMSLAGLGTAGALIGQQPPLPQPMPPEHGPAPNAAPAPFELDEITVSELQEGLSGGRFTSRKLTEAYLGRIEAIDKRGPAINAVIEINPDALAIADAADRAPRS